MYTTAHNTDALRCQDVQWPIRVWKPLSSPEGIENLPWWTFCLFWLAPVITTIYRPFVFYQFIPRYTLRGHTWISIWCNCPFASPYLCFHFILMSVQCSHTCNHHTIHLEVPVYWPTTFSTPQVYHNAQAQLHSLMVPSCRTPCNGFVCFSNHFTFLSSFLSCLLCL